MSDFRTKHWDTFLKCWILYQNNCWLLDATLPVGFPMEILESSNFNK